MGFRRRLLLLYLLGCTGAAAVWLRVAWLQVVSADHWQAAARRARERVVELNPTRGPIVDADGETLVEDVPVLQLVLIPAEWRTRHRLRCAECGTVHFIHPEKPRRVRCRCKAPADRLQPLGTGDLAPLERALGVEPGFVARQAQERLRKIEQQVQARERALQAQDGDDFMVEQRVMLFREEREHLPHLLAADVSDEVARLVSVDEAGVTRGLMLRPGHRRAAVTAGALARVVGESVLPTAELLDRVRRNDPELAEQLDLSLPLGVSGLEQCHDVLLRGRGGHERRARDEQGRFSIARETQPPVGGHRLVLSASRAACEGAQRCLESLPGLEQGYGPRTQASGALVLMNALTGEILALAELPVFDPARARAGARDSRPWPEEIVPLADAELGAWVPGRAVLGERKPAASVLGLTTRTHGLARLTLPWLAHERLVIPRRHLPEDFDLAAWRRSLCLPVGASLSRVSQVAVEPGSTLKVFIGLAMLESGIGLPTERELACERHGKPGCHPHLPVDFRGAVRTSCNQYFAHSLREFPSHWRTYQTSVAAFMDRLGFGHATGSDLGGEARGQWLRREEWRPGESPRIDPDDAYNVAIGQGPVLVTPLQMVRAVAVLANGGRLVTPHLAARLESPDGGYVGPDAPIVDLSISPASLRRVRDAMEAVVYEYGGTAYEKGPWDRLPARVFGKTGTAQTNRAWWPFEPPEQSKRVTHQWFVGFAEPEQGPPLAFAVVHHARSEGSAGQTAVKTAGALLSWWFSR